MYLSVLINNKETVEYYIVNNLTVTHIIPLLYNINII